MAGGTGSGSGMGSGFGWSREEDGAWVGGGGVEGDGVLSGESGGLARSVVSRLGWDGDGLCCCGRE